MTARTATADYVLPLKWDDDREVDDLTRYLTWLATRVRVIVVDGSADLRFAAHARRWHGLVEHVPPSPAISCRNGKVAGVLTGMSLVSAEKAILADDDVRYDEQSLQAVLDRLDSADLVGPQNVFRPLPWHARYDTARSLLNRSFGADYPGTFGVRVSTFRAMAGYDGDVLFENLELMRTVRAAGGRVLRPRGIYVERRPPDARRFWGQRVRQAYDDLAQPGRLVWSASALPVLVGLVVGRRYRLVAAAAVGVVGLAEVGRSRAGGRRVLPASSSWLAPVWVLERAFCIWAAIYLRAFRGGVPYAGRRLAVAAHRRSTVLRLLRDRLTAQEAQVRDGSAVGRTPGSSWRDATRRRTV